MSAPLSQMTWSICNFFLLSLPYIILVPLSFCLHPPQSISCVHLFLIVLHYIPSPFLIFFGVGKPHSHPTNSVSKNLNLIRRVLFTKYFLWHFQQRYPSVQISQWSAEKALQNSVMQCSGYSCGNSWCLNLVGLGNIWLTFDVGQLLHFVV